MNKIFYFYRVMNENRIEEIISNNYDKIVIDGIPNMNLDSINNYYLEIWEYGSFRCKLSGEDIYCEEYSEFAEILIDIL